MAKDRFEDMAKKRGVVGTPEKEKDIMGHLRQAQWARTIGEIGATVFMYSIEGDRLEKTNKIIDKFIDELAAALED